MINNVSVEILYIKNLLFAIDQLRVWAIQNVPKYIIIAVSIAKSYWGTNLKWWPKLNDIL